MKTKMRNSYLLRFVLISFLGVFISCKSKYSPEIAKPIVTENSAPEIDTDHYFKARGNEPSWHLKIGEKTIVFQSLIAGMELLTFSHVEPIKAMDANVKMYRLENSKRKATIQIVQKECFDTMSGEKFSHQVSVTFLPSETHEQEQNFNGCGNYLPNYRLHDIWALEELNDRSVNAAEFAKQPPYIEINLRDNVYAGYAGCNEVHGKIFQEREILRFSHPYGPLLFCGSDNKEEDFLKALQNVTTYFFQNNRLWLSSPSGVILVFKKVD